VTVARTGLVLELDPDRRADTRLRAAPPLPEAAATPPRPGVVERMTQILDVFLAGEGPYRLEDVTSCTGLPRSTTFRLLSQLVRLQWLEHGVNGYRLGGRVLGMPSRDVDHRELRSAAADVLNELHLSTGAVAHLGVLDGATVTYLDKVGGRAATTMPSRVGGRLPAYRTVMGRALLACLPAERVDLLLSADSADRNRPLDLPRLHEQLQRIRQRNGLSLHEVRRQGPDISAIAAPVRGPEGAVGAIGLASRGALRLEPTAPLVAAAARRISQLMFPGWAPPTASSASRRSIRG
jgi:DNA-binding IclR family transcriptional regulator